MIGVFGFYFGFVKVKFVILPYGEEPLYGGDLI